MPHPAPKDREILTPIQGVQRIFKYPTGYPIPKGSVYLSTTTQTQEFVSRSTGGDWQPCYFVWHYFLVETAD